MSSWCRLWKSKDDSLRKDPWTLSFWRHVCAEPKFICINVWYGKIHTSVNFYHFELIPENLVHKFRLLQFLFRCQNQTVTLRLSVLVLSACVAIEITAQEIFFAWLSVSKTSKIHNFIFIYPIEPILSETRHKFDDLYFFIL